MIFLKAMLKEVLYDEKAARLRITQFLHYPLHWPAQRRLIGFGADGDDGRQHS